MKKISLLLVSILMVGCAKNAATGKYDFNLVTGNERKKLGQETAAQAVKEAGGVYDENDALTRYLNERVAEIVSVSETPDETFRVRFLDNHMVNAFATPGYTMINRGILPFFNSEAEMMTVIGHEVAHVTARHIEKSVSGGRLLNVVLQGVSIGMGQSGASSHAVDAVSQASGMLAGLGMRKWSRDHESQADNLGLRYMSKLCYKPQAAVDGLRVLKSAFGIYDEVTKVMGNPKEDSLLNELLSTHPKTDDRLAALQIAANRSSQCGEIIHKNRFYKHIDGMAYGPKVNEGFGGRKRYYDAEHPVTFDLPKGWMFPNFYGLPLAVSTHSKVWLQASVEKAEEKQSAQDILLQIFPQIDDVKVHENQGLKTYYVAIEDDVKVPFFVMAFKLESHPKEVVLMKVTAKTDEDFKQAKSDVALLAKSIRPISKVVAKKLEPLRIKIYAVKKGDTIYKLSRKMAVGALAEEYFRALNGLEKGEHLRTGQLVKMIVDPNEKIKL